MTEEALKAIEEEIALLEAEGKKISVSNKMKLKKLQRTRDKAKSPIEPSSVFVPDGTAQEDVRRIEIDKILMPEFNDRTGIDNKKIIELAESIKENGLIQPIILMENSDGSYTKIAGRRRILATQLNGNKKIEAIVKRERLESNKFNLLVLHENTQREDLSSYDKVRSVLHFIEQEFNVTQLDAKKLCHKVNNFNKGNLVKEEGELEKISEILNRILAETKVFSSVTHLVKHLPVLEMPIEILELLESNQITFGMALIFNQFRDAKFKEDENFSTIIAYVLAEEMSQKDAKAYFKRMLYQKETNNNPDLSREIKGRLSKLSKIVDLLEADKQQSFHDELDQLLRKYK